LSEKEKDAIIEEALTRLKPGATDDDIIAEGQVVVAPDRNPLDILDEKEKKDIKK